MDRHLPPGPVHRHDRRHVHRLAARALGGGGGSRGVTNVTWEVVQKEYDQLRRRYPQFCGCDTCRGDVLIYALNRLSPHYVSTRQGEILTELTLESDQERAKLDVMLLEGFRKVALAPRCGAKPVSLL